MFIFFLEVDRQANPKGYLIMGMFLLVYNKDAKNFKGHHTHLYIHMHTLAKRYTEIKKNLHFFGFL